ncbi:hypothetical protein Dvina_19400 [Dactylosporangium vinaceum]|uniref:Uncharacterized protein n=1 Tax=Dactylosporangium vinaceum TaxID=53362 RepID=A0ABV5M9G8_9ACTN|nr:hypothetical protein [Dactylosporangium vinaceum]UAC00029.1 hypothetical protein Dvina_19400 [Dactylosporangium vinaceum]
MERGGSGFGAAIAELQAQRPDRLPYIKELAAYLGDEQIALFDRDDRFLVVVRDPAQQVASTVLGVLRNPGPMRQRLAEVRGREVSEQELRDYLDAQAGTSFSDWSELIGYVRRTHDFQPIGPTLSELFDAQPDRDDCDDGLEWFDRSLFQVGTQSWSRAVELLARLRDMGAERVTVVDFTVLQTRPELAAAVCDRLDLEFHPRMTDGGWDPASRWFTSGLELSDGDLWVGKAARSRSLERPLSIPYDPLTLVPPASDAFLAGLGDYLRVLADPALVWPRTAADVEQVLHSPAWRRDGTGYAPDEHHTTFTTKHPVSAWCLATAVLGPSCASAQAVEAANPHLAEFFAVARGIAESATTVSC